MAAHRGLLWHAVCVDHAAQLWRCELQSFVARLPCYVTVREVLPCCEVFLPVIMVLPVLCQITSRICRWQHQEQHMKSSSVVL